MVGQETITHTYRQHWGSRRDYALENDDYMWLQFRRIRKDKYTKKAIQ